MEEILPIDPEDIEMSLTEIGPCEYQIVIRVSPRHAKRFNKKLKKSGQDASVESTTKHLTNFCIEQGIKRFELQPIFGPILTPSSTPPIFRIGHEFALSIDVDSSPEIAWPDFASLKLVRPIREVTDNMIEQEMVQQQRDAGTKEKHSEQIQVGDEIICDVSLGERGNEEPIYKQKNVAFHVPNDEGTAKIFHLDVEGLAKKVLASSVGNAISAEVEIPDDYLDPTLSGKTATIKVAILESLRITPVTVEEVVKQYGSPNETILKQQIRTAIQGKITRDQNTLMANQIFNQLLDCTDVPIPSRVEQDFYRALVQSTEAYMAKMGCSPQAISERIESKKKDITKVSNKLARKRTLSNLLCQHFNIKMQEDKIIAHIGHMAAEQGRRPEELREEIMNSGRIKGVAVQVMELEAIEKVIELASVTEMPAEEWLEQQKTTASADE